MPFDNPFPRALTIGSIRTYVPSASGIFGISNSREWIYIGESDDIQTTLINYLEHPDSEIMQQQPTGFVFELCCRTIRFSRQDRLVFEYEPIYNRTLDHLLNNKRRS